MKRRARIGLGVAVAALVVGAAGCTDPSPEPSPPSASPAPSATASGGPTPSPSPTLSEWDAALAEAHALPLEVAAGSVIMQAVRQPDAAAAAKLVRTRHLAGLFVGGDAITDAESLAQFTAAIADADPTRAWPVMIATDEEGGEVQRLRPVLGYVSAFMAAGANGDPAQVREYYAGLGAQMADLGFTMDLAPVADVTVGVKDPTIGTRAAGSRPDAVAEVVDAAWQGLEEGGVTPVLKHFPGHGSLTADSHHVVPVQGQTVVELESRDLVPFATAVASGAPAVMLGHIRVPEWGKAPATVNPRAYEYLRGTLGFEGLAVTDAMNMAAITDVYSSGAAAAAALRAGADLVLMPADTDKAIAGIAAAVADGTLTRERLDEAVARVMFAARGQAAGTGSAVEAKRPQEFVEGSIVVAARKCAALIGPAVKISGGTKTQRATLRKELRARGVKIDASGTAILLVDGDRGAGKASVVVALGGPWGLPKSTARTYVATWGSGVAQMRALAAVLAGDITPRGTWPVKVKLPYATCG